MNSSTDELERVQTEWRHRHQRPVTETVGGPVPLVCANAEQVGGDHYRAQAIQPWDFIAANGLGFFEGNVVKYVARWRTKGGVDDLRKAVHYLQKLIELETSE